MLARWSFAQEGTEPQPKTTAADLIEGERTFGSQCAYCHGPKGEGGIGPVLAAPRLRRAPDDPALFQIIRDGISGTRMPASALTGAQIWQLAAYVRKLGRGEQPKSAGDPRRGAQIYAGKGGCSRCHTIAGRGGAIGPDLGDIGARQNGDYIRTSIVDPQAAVPRDFMLLELVTKTGDRIAGVRLNEDSFSIQMRDLSNRVHSFWKEELMELRKQPNRSPMPSYKDTLSAEEREDLIAFLESLKESK